MEQQILDIWVDLHQGLKKFIFSKVKDESMSKDLLQEVFIKIQMNLHTLDDRAKLTSWVYQITRNTVNDYFRKTNLEVEMGDVNIAVEEVDDLLYQSLSTCINSKINKLSDKYKEVILLTSFENYSQLALAKTLNISYSGAKTRVQRAREKLKNLIADCDNVETDSKGKLIDFHTV